MSKIVIITGASGYIGGQTAIYFKEEMTEMKGEREGFIRGVGGSKEGREGKGRKEQGRNKERKE